MFVSNVIIWTPFEGNLNQTVKYCKNCKKSIVRLALNSQTYQTNCAKYQPCFSQTKYYLSGDKMIWVDHLNVFWNASGRQKYVYPIGSTFKYMTKTILNNGKGRGRCDNKLSVNFNAEENIIGLKIMPNVFKVT